MSAFSCIATFGTATLLAIVVSGCRASEAATPNPSGVEGVTVPTVSFGSNLTVEPSASVAQAADGTQLIFDVRTATNGPDNVLQVEITNPAIVDVHYPPFLYIQSRTSTNEWTSGLVVPLGVGEGRTRPCSGLDECEITPEDPILLPGATRRLQEIVLTDELGAGPFRVTMEPNVTGYSVVFSR